MKIVFIGSVSFSKLALKRLLELKADIVGVVTKQHSSYNSDFEDLSSLAIQNNIDYKFANNINHENNVKWIADLKPDVIFCFGWSNLIKKPILEIPLIGVIGYHPAMLPNNKGRHPLIWAKVLGLNKTGSSFFFMDEGADSGDLLSQKEIEIEFEDNAESIYAKVVETAIFQIEEFLPKLIEGTYVKSPQSKDQGNVWRKRGMNDGRIDFRMTTESICNLVRGLDKPYVGAHCEYKGNNIKIWTVTPGFNNTVNLEPGKVLSVSEKSIEVKTGNGSIFILNHEFEALPTTEDYIF